jgi:hypothetical protein
MLPNGNVRLAAIVDNDAFCASGNVKKSFRRSGSGYGQTTNTTETGRRSG